MVINCLLKTGAIFVILKCLGIILIMLIRPTLGNSDRTSAIAATLICFQQVSTLEISVSFYFASIYVAIII